MKRKRILEICEWHSVTLLDTQCVDIDAAGCLTIISADHSIRKTAVSPGQWRYREELDVVPEAPSAPTYAEGQR